MNNLIKIQFMKKTYIIPLPNTLEELKKKQEKKFRLKNIENFDLVYNDDEDKIILENDEDLKIAYKYLKKKLKIHLVKKKKIEKKIKINKEKENNFDFNNFLNFTEKVKDITKYFIPCKHCEFDFDNKIIDKKNFNFKKLYKLFKCEVCDTDKEIDKNWFFLFFHLKNIFNFVNFESSQESIFDDVAPNNMFNQSTFSFRTRDSLKIDKILELSKIEDITKNKKNFKFALKKPMKRQSTLVSPLKSRHEKRKKIIRKSYFFKERVFKDLTNKKKEKKKKKLNLEINETHLKIINKKKAEISIVIDNRTNFDWPEEFYIKGSPNCLYTKHIQKLIQKKIKAFSVNYISFIIEPEFCLDEIGNGDLQFFFCVEDFEKDFCYFSDEFFIENKMKEDSIIGMINYREEEEDL